MTKKKNKNQAESALWILLHEVDEDRDWIINEALNNLELHPKWSATKCFAKAIKLGFRLDGRAKVIEGQRLHDMAAGMLLIMPNPLATTPVGFKSGSEGGLWAAQIVELCCQEQDCWYEPHNIGDKHCRYVLIHGEVICKDEVQDTTTIPMVEPEACVCECAPCGTCGPHNLNADGSCPGHHVKKPWVKADPVL